LEQSNMDIALEALQDTITRIATDVGPAVVGLGRGWGRGSGVVVAPGRVLAVAHDLRGDEIAVTFGDGRVAEGRVAGADRDLDVAVIAVDTGDVTPVAWVPADGDDAPAAGAAADTSPAARPALGLPVLALADPGGRGLRVTFGLVSSTGRSFRGPRGRRVAGLIEHTAPLPRGSSGGPLVDADGRLLGLNAVRRDGGFILALPADAALRRHVEELARGEVAERPRLGVALAPPRIARRMRAAVGLPDRDGLLVRGVVEGSPAHRAGLERGDLLVRAGETALAGTDDLFDALDAAADTLALGVVRGAEETTIEVDLRTP
jgi:serine protease Do